MTIELVLLPGMDGTGELFGPLLARLPLDLRASVDEYVAHAREPRLLRVEGPHLLLQANPDRCAKAIAEFIADCR